MITKKIDENSVSLIPEEPDDLFVLRRTIKKEDRLVGDTTRAIKQEKEFARPDRGERVKIRIAISVEKVSIDDVVDRLKVQGKIIESDSESVQKGSYHSLTLKIGEPITLTKKKWDELEKKLIFSKKENFGFLLVAIDTSDCGIGRLSGTHLKLKPNLYSGASGKRYKAKFNIETFFEDVLKAILTSLRDGDVILIFGPGETRKRFGNYLTETSIGKKHKIQIIDGIDSGGEDGIYTFVKSSAMKEALADSKLAKVSKIIDQIMLLVNKKSNKFTMGLAETEKANDVGAVDCLIFSDKIFEKQDEDKIIEFLNKAESKGTEIFSVDSTTDIGLRVSALGGIVSLLRFIPN